MKLEDLSTEQQEKISEFGLNTWYVLELLDEYQKDPGSVSDNWKTLFKELELNKNDKNYQRRQNLFQATDIRVHKSIFPSR